MQIGIVGLGKMGGNMSRRLMKAGHHCVVYSRTAKTREVLAKDGATAGVSLADVVRTLGERPRAIWLMLPAGQVTEETVESLAALLERDDIIIDGGNSFYKDDVRRAKKLAENCISYIDCGTFGGVWGVERGYCMMARSRPWITSIRSFRRSLPALAISRARQGARKAIPVPSADTFTPVRPAPGTSSRWCITESRTD